jgi:hypothetical protein
VSTTRERTQSPEVRRPTATRKRSRLGHERRNGRHGRLDGRRTASIHSEAQATVRESPMDDRCTPTQAVGPRARRLRITWLDDPGDEAIAWAIQTYRSADQLERCLRLLRSAYPTSRIEIIADGDGVNYDAIARAYNCHLTVGAHLYGLATAHQYVRRLLAALVAGPEEYLFKIDPDTHVRRRLKRLPAVSSIFGTLETLTACRHREIRVPANVQGGCIGLTRDAVEELLLTNLITRANCADRCLHTWARCYDMERTVRRGRFCDDFILSWACHALGIPALQCAEIRSRWRGQGRDEDTDVAISHPHKQTGTEGC